MRIAFDSQVLSYFRQANQPGYDPEHDQDAHAKHKVAAFCLWMYAGNPVVVPTAFRECNAIPDEPSRREHFNWNAYHFSEVLASWLDEKRVESRAAELGAFHSGANDCRIVAECEEPGAAVDALAAFDRKLLKRLTGRSRIPILTPLQCLLRAGVAEDSTPKVNLHAEHPHAGATWWRIDNVLRRWRTEEWIGFTSP
jgi:hypothetical protein